MSLSGQRFKMLLSFAIKTQLKAHEARGISCLSLVLYGIGYCFHARKESILEITEEINLIVDCQSSRVDQGDWEVSTCDNFPIIFPNCHHLCLGRSFTVNPASSHNDRLRFKRLINRFWLKSLIAIKNQPYKKSFENS